MKNDLFASEYNAAYADWISLDGSSSSNYKALLLNEEIADPFRVRALRDMINGCFSSLEIAQVPERFQRLAVDLIFQKAEQPDEQDRSVEALLLQVAKLFPADEERVVDLLYNNTSPKRLAGYVRYSDLPLHLKRRIDRRLRKMVLEDVERESKHADAWKDRSRWFYHKGQESALSAYVDIAIGCLCEFHYQTTYPCDMTLRREQVYFLAARDVPVFWTSGVYAMLRLHFSGVENATLRGHVLRLIAREAVGKDWRLFDRDWCEEWMRDIAGDAFTSREVEAALSRGKQQEENNRKWRVEEDARRSRVMAALRVR